MPINCHNIIIIIIIINNIQHTINYTYNIYRKQARYNSIGINCVFGSAFTYIVHDIPHKSRITNMVNSPACCNFRISDFFRFLLLFLARHTIGNVILPPDRALLLLLSRIERRPLVKYYFYYHLIVVLCWLRFFFCCFFFLLVGTVLMMCKQNAGACRMEYVVRRRPSHAIKNILLYSNLLFTLCQHKLKCFIYIYINL